MIASMLVALSTAAAAPIQADLADEAQLHFTLGLEAYKARQFPTALAHLLQSNRLAPNSNTSFNVALCYDRLAQPAQAWRYYAASLQQTEADRDAEAAMNRLTPLIGRLSIDSDPPGARVYVERRDLGERGTTPLLLALRPGGHTIIVERDGYLPVTFERSLGPGDSDSVAVPLTAVSPAESGATSNRWVRSTVRFDGEVVLDADPTGCRWLPERGPLPLTPGPAAGEVAVPDATAAPGSRLASGATMPFSLDVTVAVASELRTTRSRLHLVRGSHLQEASDIRQWALAACPPLGRQATRPQAASILEDLPKALRRAAVAVLAEAAGESEQLDDAATACSKGSCQRLLDAL